MRTLAKVIAVFAAVGLVASAASAITVDVQWDQASIAVGGTATASIYIDATDTPGMKGYQLSVQYDTAGNNLADVTASQEIVNGAFFDTNFAPCCTVTESGLGSAGQVGEFEASAFFSPGGTGVFLIGTVTVMANAPGTLDMTGGFFVVGEGMLDAAFGTVDPATVTFNTGSLTIVPEPATASLLALGLLGLGLAGRRRS